MEKTNPTRCRQCLLRETLSPAEYEKTVLRAKAAIKPHLLAAQDVYEYRLERCSACEHLQSGTCMRCGCLVEVRALRADLHCPPPKRCW